MHDTGSGGWPLRTQGPRRRRSVGALYVYNEFLTSKIIIRGHLSDGFERFGHKWKAPMPLQLLSRS